MNNDKSLIKAIKSKLAIEDACVVRHLGHLLDPDLEPRKVLDELFNFEVRLSRDLEEANRDFGIEYLI